MVHDKYTPYIKKFCQDDNIDYKNLIASSGFHTGFFLGGGGGGGGECACIW